MAGPFFPIERDGLFLDGGRRRRLHRVPIRGLDAEQVPDEEIRISRW